MSDQLTILMMPAIGPGKASSLGKFLGKYEISTSGLGVWQCIHDQGCERNRALTETVTQTASAVGASVAMTPVAAPAAVPITGALMLIFGQWLLPILLAMLAGEIGMIHIANRNMPKAVTDDETKKKRLPDYSEIRFNLANVSAKRRKWTEYLIYLWCANNGGQLRGARYPAGENEAARAIAKYGAGYFPKPWKEQRPGYQRKGKRSKTARKASRAKRGLWREIKSLL